MGILQSFALDGRVTLVTGGAQGLGYAMAQALAEAGSDLVIADIQLANAEKATAALASCTGKKVCAVYCDVTKPEDCQKAVEFTVKEFGKLDILLNNAGICKHIAAETVDPADWLSVININLNGVFFMAQAASRVMIPQGHGNIVNISSMSGVVVNTPQPQASYNASKAGVIQLTKSLASEWAAHNIRVNTIAPGYMCTEMTQHIFDEGGEWARRWMDFTPMGRPGQPHELGGLVVFLASDASSYCNGGVYLADGGYSIW